MAQETFGLRSRSRSRSTWRSCSSSRPPTSTRSSPSTRCSSSSPRAGTWWRSATTCPAHLGRRGHRRAPEGAARGRAGRDHAGRAGHAAAGRVPVRLRGRRRWCRSTSATRGTSTPEQGRPHPGGAPVMAETVLIAELRPRRTRTRSRGYRADRRLQAPRDKALAMEPAAITEEVKKSNLRGLGGAGFPTGDEVGFIPKSAPGPVYLVVNADEGEPGTFKDRYLLERDPHALIEGMLIAACAIGSPLGFVYIRGEYVQPWRVFSAAVQGGVRRRAAGHEHPRRGLRPRSSSTAARAPTSAARRRGSSPPSRARRAGRRSSRRSRRSRAPSASRRSSTTSRRLPRAAHHRRAAPSGSRGSAPRRRAGTRLYSVSGHVEQARRLRGVGGDHAARS